MRRIIQAGLGAMGQHWADCVAASPYWEAAAYVDPDRSRLMAAAARHGMPRTRCFSDLDEALQVIEADAVLDISPQACRKGVCIAAMTHGLDVLAEKPLTTSVRDAMALVARAKKLGRTLMVVQDYRYQAVSQTARRVIASGRLGSIGYASVEFYRGPILGGFREKMAYPLILDMCIHHLDLMRFLFDTDIRAVQAVSVNVPWNWNAGDATLAATVEMKNGIAVGYTASWVSRGRETPWNANWRIEGEKSSLLWEDDVLYVSDGPNRRRKKALIKFPHHRQHYMLRALAESLDTGREPETSARRNLNSFAATHALVRAAKTRRRVLVGDLLKAKKRRKS